MDVIDGSGRNERRTDSPAEGWLRLSEGVIAGIHHALNNRMATLSAVAQLLEADLSPSHPLHGSMTGELDRLESTVTLLRLLTGGEADFEPLQIETVFGQVRQLSDVHHGLRYLRLEQSQDPGLLPLWTQPVLLLRALMLMLAIAAGREGQRVQLLRLTATGDDSVIHLSVAGSEAEDEGALSDDFAGISERDVVAIAERLGARFEREGDHDDSRLTLTLPTLLEARRQTDTAAE